MKGKARPLSPCQSAAERIRHLLPMTIDDWARIKDQFPGLTSTLTLADPAEQPIGRLILTIEAQETDERATASE